jgi:hypothetical protein
VRRSYLIFVVLLAQFNRFLSVGLVLSAVVMSTIGVLLGLIIMGQPFGIVMTGIGVIALAGVVVNNNIVLIDTYDHLRRENGLDKLDAILETCRERARPVVLTAVTAILACLPIAFGFNLELMAHETTYGAPSTQWWISLSSAIVFGLAFSTVLTLVVTPSLLMIVTRSKDSKITAWWERVKARIGLGGKPAKTRTQMRRVIRRQGCRWLRRGIARAIPGGRSVLRGSPVPCAQSTWRPRGRAAMVSPKADNPVGLRSGFVGEHERKPLQAPPPEMSAPTRTGRMAGAKTAAPESVRPEPKT